MKTKEIEICGKKVTMSYCYATEIGYKMLTGEEIHSFMHECFLALNDKPVRMPDVQKCVCMIVSSIMAYYESKDIEPEKVPVTDKTLMYEANTQEIILALGTVISLHNEFYNIPADEPKGEESEGGKKNS